MWNRIREKFSRQKSRLSVARKMVEIGIRVDEEGQLYAGDIAVDDTAIAKAVGVDRRVVRHTVKQILGDEELKNIFTRIRPVGTSMVGFAERLGYGVLVISADPHESGVVASVTSVLAEYGVVIRQALADDPDLIPEPRLTLVVQGKVPPEAIGRIQALPKVKSLTLLK